MAGDSFARAYEIQQKNRKKIGDAPQLLYYSAAAYFQGERYPQALKIIERLLNRADLSGQVEQQEWIRLKIHILCQLSRWRTATETLLDLLDRQPQLADYWKLLAQVELHRNRYSQAAAALETSYLLAPPEKSGWLQLADIYLYLNAPLPAARCRQKTIDEYGPRKIVRLYEKTNRYDLAISQCNQLIARHPCADNYLLKGNIQLKGGMARQSIESFVAATKAPPCQFDRKNKEVSSIKETQGEAWLMAALAAWQDKKWMLALDFFALAGQTVPPYSTRGEMGLRYLHAIVADRFSSIPVGFHPSGD